MADDYNESLRPSSPPSVLSEDSAVEIIQDRDSLVSLTSSCLEYDVEHERTYHSLSRGKYPLPNDDHEMNRLDMMHEIWNKTWGKPFLCPGDHQARRVLDLGTGSGIWAIDYAEANPASKVIGVDLSPSQTNWVPPNCSFEVDDLEKYWTWRAPFDYMFLRSMIGSFRYWSDIVSKCFANLEPGGWLEIQDHTYPLVSDDGSLDGTRLSEWSSLMVKAAKKLERPIDVAPTFQTLMIEAGFTDVEEKVIKVPLGGWSPNKELKELGQWSGAMFYENLEGLTCRLLEKGLDYTHDQVLALVDGVREEQRTQSIHAYSLGYGVYGRKPSAQVTS